MFSGITRTLNLNITEAQLAAWQGGTVIQTAMPQLSADEREFVMTGVTAEEWAETFDEEDEEESAPDPDHYPHGEDFGFFGEAGLWD